MKKKYVLIALLALSLNTVFAQYPTNGLIGYYPFSGNLEDASTNNADMSSSSTPGYYSDRFGNAGNAYESGSRAYIPSVQNSTDISFSLWIQPMNIADFYPAIFSRVLYGFNSGNQVVKVGNYQMYLSPNGNNKFEIIMEYHFGGDGSGAYTVVGDLNSQTTTLDPAEWAHIVTTIEGTTAKMYINGVLEHTVTFTSPIVAIQAPDPQSGYDLVGDLVMGTSTQVNVSNGIVSNYLNFTGFIDDFFIYNRALTQEEITTIYNLPFNAGPSTNGLEENVNHFSIHPNPVQDVLTIDFQGESYDYEITTLSGQIVRSESQVADHHVSVADLASGFYLLKVTQNGQSQSLKIYKN